jgi:hypothetical protein
MLNPKLEILNSKQSQIFKAQNSKLVAKTFELPFGFYDKFCILDLFRV